MKRLRNDKVTDTTGEQPIMPDDELTGPPGNPQDAERYDTGMVSDQGDADMRPVPYELEPQHDDILPDQIQRFADAPEDDDVELTARPSEPYQPHTPDELPRK